MSQLDCPACAGPDNAECATCKGTSEVTRAVHDAFMLELEREIANAQLRLALQQLPIEAIPGVEQTAIVISAIDNTITADVDSVQLVWDEATQSWV